MFQWDAVDTSPDLAGKNVLDTLQMAIRHNRRTTRTELEREFSITGFIFTFEKYFAGPHRPLLMDASLTPSHVSVCRYIHTGARCARVSRKESTV